MGRVPMWLFDEFYQAVAGQFLGLTTGFSFGLAVSFLSRAAVDDIGLMGNFADLGDDGFRLSYGLAGNQGQLNLEIGTDVGGSVGFNAQDLHLQGTTRYIVATIGPGLDANVRLWMNSFRVIDSTLGALNTYQPPVASSQLQVGFVDGSSAAGTEAQFGIHGAFYHNEALTLAQITAAFSSFTQGAGLMNMGALGDFTAAWDRRGLILPGSPRQAPSTWAPSAGAQALTATGDFNLSSMASMELNSLGG